jgi:hypothetical protein
MDEASGTTLESSHGAIDLTISGATPGVTGKVDGTAVSFDGSNDCGYTASAIDLSSYHKIVFEWLAYYDSFDNNERIFLEVGEYYSAQNGGWKIQPSAYSGYWENYHKQDDTPNGGQWTRPTSAAWHHFAVMFDVTQTGSLEVKMYLDGSIYNVTTYTHTNNSGSSNVYANDVIYLCAEYATQNFCPCDVQHLAIYSDLSEAEITTDYNAAFGAVVYSFSPLAGEFTIAGDDVGLLHNRVVAPTSGEYSIAGDSIGVLHNRVLAPTLGEYSLSGDSVALLHNRLIVPDTGSYAIAGDAIGLLHNIVIVPTTVEYLIAGDSIGLLHNLIVSPGPGEYAIVGDDIGLLHQRVIVPTAGEWVITGDAINIEVIGGGIVYSFSPLAGEFVIAGDDVGLLHNRVITPTAGEFMIYGDDVGIFKQYILAPAPGTFDIAGDSIGLLHNRVIVPAAGVFLITGDAIDIIYEGSAEIIPSVGWELYEMARPIKFGDGSFGLEFEFPIRWNEAAVTSVTLSITDDAGTVLLDDASCTLWSGVIKTGTAPEAQDLSLQVTSASIPRKGMRYRIESSDSYGNAEDVFLDSFVLDSSNEYTFTIERELRFYHAASEEVYGCYAIYSLNASDTDTFSLGRMLKLTWTPDSNDQAYTQRFVVTGVAGSHPKLWNDLRRAYPGEWELVQDEDLDSLEAIIMDGFDTEVVDLHLDSNRVVDQDILNRGRLLFARKDLLEARNPSSPALPVATKAYISWRANLASSVALWTDRNENNVNDDGEERRHTEYTWINGRAI